MLALPLINSIKLWGRVKQKKTLLVTGFLTNDYVLEDPEAFFQILTFFWTCGTIVDQYLVKGVHQ